MHNNRSAGNRRTTQRITKPNNDSPDSQNDIVQELTKLQGTHCPRPSDRYHILLKRDDLLAKLRVKSTDVKEANKLTSACPDMCPEKERYMRQVGNLLHPYELTPNGTVNHSAAVKDYARSAADQEEPLPHELRPPDVLNKTMDYLIMKMTTNVPKSELGRWYDFIWSRTRSIRKEITQQMLVDKIAVSLVEKCVRFHIYASFRMASRDTKDFDDHINTEGLSKSLQTLRHLYDDLARKSIFCDSEAEFRAYDVLLNLSDSNVLSLTHTYRSNVRNSHAFKTATKLACYFQTNNYVAFFRLVREKSSFLEACLCRPYFEELRTKALQSIARNYRPPKLPTSKLTEVLAFDNDDDTMSFMRTLNLYVEADGMIRAGDEYQSQQGDSSVDNGAPHGCWIVEEKLTSPLPEVIAGGPVSAPVFPPPVNSFTSDNYYSKDPVLLSHVDVAKKLDTLAPKTSDNFKIKDIAGNSIGAPVFPPSFNSFKSTQQNAQSATTTEKSLSRGTFLSATAGSSASTSLFSAPSTSFTFGNYNKNAITDYLSSGAKKLDNPAPKFADSTKSQPLVADPVRAPVFPTAATSFTFGNKNPVLNSFNEGVKKPENSLPKLSDPINNKVIADNSLGAPTFPSAPFNSFAFGNQNKAPTTLQPQRNDDAKKLDTMAPKLAETMKNKLIDGVIGFCIDDFVWLAAREVIERETEAARQKRAQRIEKVCDRLLPELARTSKNELYGHVFNHCIDDFIWLAARELLDRQQQTLALLHKHNMRIVKPYAYKWLDRARSFLFLAKLPTISGPSKRAYPSPTDGPSSKRSKKFTPLYFK